MLILIPFLSLRSDDIGVNPKIESQHNICIVYAITLVLINTLTIRAFPVYGNKSYVVYCGFEAKLYAFIGMGLLDVIFSLCTLYAFIRPVQRLIKSILTLTTSDVIKEDMITIMQIGVKYTILQCVMSVSTVVLMVLLAMGYLFMASWDYIEHTLYLLHLDLSALY